MEKKSSSSYRKRKHESLRYSINVCIFQSRWPRENSHTALGQLVPEVHHSCNFESITTSSVASYEKSRPQVALMVVLAGILCSR